MNIFPSHGLAGAIVRELASEPVETSLLMDRLAKRGFKVTKQGVYKALAQLRAQDIAFLQKGKVILNAHWLQRLNHFVSVAQHQFLDPKLSAGHFANLRDGERITYSFKNPVLVDTFWNHVLYILFETIPDLKNWYAYCPHHWFLLAHRQDELSLMKYMADHNIHYLFTCGHRAPLDRYMKKDFDGNNAQYHTLEKPLHISNRYLFNVLGDYIIEAWYDASVAKRIESFYSMHNKVTDQDILTLQKIVSTHARTKFVISRNRKKAERLRRPLKKYFHS
jgi:hypothetical protein